MIEAIQVSKRFGDIQAVNEVDLTIKTGEVFGLIGSNGAGKSTFLRMLAGVYRPDSGVLKIDGSPVYENIAVKSRCFYISDDQYFLSNSTPEEMKNFYRMYYEHFDEERFYKLMQGFDLDANRKIRTFAKGMKKQVSVICGVCAGVDYLFCDETFDGLDPVARQAVKSLFAEDVAERGLTPVIASHNLRELEDICDHVGLLHQGGVLLSEDLADMKLNLQKVQVVFASEEDREAATADLNILLSEQRGRLWTYTIRGERSEVESHFRHVSPVFFEVLKLSLEEIFISETEVVGYDIRKFILG